MTISTTSTFLDRSGELTTTYGDIVIAGISEGKLVLRLYTDDDLVDLTREDLVAMLEHLDKAEAGLQE